MHSDRMLSAIADRNEQRRRMHRNDKRAGIALTLLGATLLMLIVAGHNPAIYIVAFVLSFG